MQTQVLTARPAWVTRQRNSAKLFGRNATAASPQHKLPRAMLIVKSPQRYRSAGIAVSAFVR